MMDNTQTMEEREFDWDDEIEHDSPDFILLPEGDYDFEVIKYERGRFNGSPNFPPCNKAIIHIKIEAPEGMNIIKHNLFMHSKSEGKLCEFFAGIGQRQKGEKLKMNWPAVPESRGRAKVTVRHWKNDEKGTEGDVNEIKKFYPYEVTTPFEAKQTTFTPGAF